MTLTNVHISIGVMLLSFSIGFLAYYVISEDVKKGQKKILMGETLNQLVNFVIYIWLGKVLLNIPLFIKDPLAVLAYPSNSHAFYFAILVSVIALIIKTKRGKMDVVPFLHTFIHIFLFSTFIYEFIQFVWYDNRYSIAYMGLMVLLIVALLLTRRFLSVKWQNVFIYFAWTLGSFMLTLFLPIMAVFGYKTMVFRLSFNSGSYINRLSKTAQ
ncbi:hypothetical protein [Oceanobacillus kapialis]|uniref:hypothetical protein n=1 Tax=Oceanobacillus kapialis TaxID=481353 RepID=UPI00384A472A